MTGNLNKKQPSMFPDHGLLPRPPVPKPATLLRPSRLTLRARIPGIVKTPHCALSIPTPTPTSSPTTRILLLSKIDIELRLPLSLQPLTLLALLLIVDKIRAVALAMPRRPTRPLLLLRGARIPAQRAGDTIEPLEGLAHDGGEGVSGSADDDLVAAAELDAAFAVEGDEGAAAPGGGQGDFQRHVVVE